MSVAVSWRMEGQEVRVPEWGRDWKTFRRWTECEDFPQHGHIAYLRGAVWIDMSKEQIFSHNQFKTKCAKLLDGIIEGESLGLYFSDGAYLSHEEADVFNQPDGMFVSSRSLQEGRVRLVEESDEGVVEVEGSPEIVLEVGSASSVIKDTITLREAYAAAGISEYWILNARALPPAFELLLLREGTYHPARSHEDWLFSPALARWFRLVPFEQAGFASFRLQSHLDHP